MDEADATPDGGRDADEGGASTNGDTPTWASLFERASTYGIEEAAVRETLARRRGEGDD
ncbi:hypothetical protein ACFQE8_09405 [Salinirubellus sp. GCM10025818]|jgi:hypothetical protein|uniref:hypothetical protein n=1 Tax=Salinirubellus TaxID=2162630 RepID=UPI0030D5C46E